MNSPEYLLAKLAEECNEVAQRCLKAQIFGLDEIQPEQPWTNAERITQELNDLIAAVKMLTDRGLILAPDDKTAQDAKEGKVVHFSRYSQELGCLSEPL